MSTTGRIAAEGHAQRYSPRPLTDGERWTAEALSDLRRRRYRPGAWVALLRSSLERSHTTRSQRPALARQAASWGLVGGGAWSAASVAARRCGPLDPPAIGGLAGWLLVWRMLDWHLGMAEGGDGRSRARLSSADALTLTRFWLVPALPAAARDGAALPAVIVLGGVTDWLDGAVARRHGRTRLGRDLLSLGAVFGRARRPAVRARPWGAVLRVGGLALCTDEHPRVGTLLLVGGCLIPPRSTAPSLSLA